MLTAREWGVSPRRFYGWEPAEVYTFLDANGQPTTSDKASTVVVERESEWDDFARSAATGLRQYENTTCPSCHGHMSKTLDDQLIRTVEAQPYECLDCKAIDTRRSQYHSKHRHKGESKSCESCNSVVFYVAGYKPLPIS